eukprot:1516188-Alexandrium_andersonii.AAC.1
MSRNRKGNALQPAIRQSANPPIRAILYLRRARAQQIRIAAFTRAGIFTLQGAHCSSVQQSAPICYPPRRTCK